MKTGEMKKSDEEEDQEETYGRSLVRGRETLVQRGPRAQHRSLLIAFIVAIGLAFPAWAQTPKKYSLLVAVTTYEHPHLNQAPKILYPEADATAISSELKASGYEVELLLGEAATRDAINKKLAGLAQKGNQPGVVLIGFFGHGVEYDEKGDDGKPASRSYFCPYDAGMRHRLDEKGRETFNAGKPQIEPDPATLTSMGSVFKAMSLSKSGNRVLLADCCRNDPHAARGIRSRGFGTSVTSEELMPEGSNTAALFACSKGERAFEDPVSKHGAFTRCVLDWMKNPQGRPTASSLGDHLDEAVPQLVASLSDGVQTQKPRYLNAGKVDLQLKLAPVRVFEGKTTGESNVLVPGMTFHWCPPGSFTMGTPGGTDDEKPAEVTLSTGFWLCETEVTQNQWQTIMAPTPWIGDKYVKVGDNYPARNVSSLDALAYCEKLTNVERSAGRLPLTWKYSLPTEAQWEYACRAGTKTTYSFGDAESELSEYGWFVANANKKNQQHARETGMKKSNSWGFKDMHGNVWEWCRDGYKSKLPGGIDPMVPSTESLRIVRGGCWYSAASFCRSAYRSNTEPDVRRHDVGFRVAGVPSS